MRNETLPIKSRIVRFTLPIIAFFICLIISNGSRQFLIHNYSLETLNDTWIMISILSPVTMILAYISSSFYTKKRKWSYCGFALMILLPATLAYIKNESLLIALSFSFTLLYNMAIGILLYMSYDWFHRMRKQKELEKQNLQSELKLLKNQLNPHFLFNTLNNIDSLIHSNPTRASEALVQMSEMMRYMIYETNAPEVNLTQELTYIENYLELQRLQYDNPDLVAYSVEGNPEGIHMAPMLFIPFIENTFKHCTDKKAKKAISLRFLIGKSEISFEAINLSDTSKHINKDSSSGIGLNVVKRRLDYLYPGKYDLQIKQENDYFCVSLKITLI